MANVEIRRKAYAPAEAALALGVSERLVAQLIADGTLPSVKLGRRRLVRAEALDALLDGLEAVEAGEDSPDAVIGLAARLRAQEERLERLEARLAAGEAS